MQEKISTITSHEPRATSHEPRATSHASCPICGSNNLKAIDTNICDFVMSRIKPDFHQGENYPIKVCFCNECTFTFYDYRMTDEEVNMLYHNYRDETYQKTREFYEPSYTKEFNDSLNNDATGIAEQKRVIERIISRNIHHELEIGLDYGGNEGRTFTDMMGTKEKYVFDISGVPTVEGVKGIARFDELKQHRYSFIMCNHVFEHLTDPMKMMQNFRDIGSDETIYYIEVPSDNPFTQFTIKSLFRRYFTTLFKFIRSRQHNKPPFMQMSEHINFFTPKSIRTMAEKSGFSVIDVQENQERGALGNITVLSMLFKK